MFLISDESMYEGHYIEVNILYFMERPKISKAAGLLKPCLNVYSYKYMYTFSHPCCSLLLLMSNIVSNA